MFRLVKVKSYENGRGHRFVFQTQRDLCIREDEGHLVFIPEGKQVEVSLIHLSPHLGGLEAAVIYNGTFIAIRRGPTMTAEKALSETLA